MYTPIAGGISQKDMHQPNELANITCDLKDYQNASSTTQKVQFPKDTGHQYRQWAIDNRQ